jgi:hypothetical protein
MIRIEYQLTFDEWVEAARVQVRVRMWAAIVAGTMISVLVLLPSPPSSAALGLAALEPLLMWLLILGLVWMSVFMALRNANWKPWRKKPRTIKPIMPVWFRRFLVPVASLVIISWVIAIRWRVELDADRAAASKAGTAFNPITTVVSMFVIIASSAFYCILPAITAMLSRKGGIFGWPYVQGWKNQAHLRRPIVAEFSESTCATSEPLSHHEYRWDYFPGWVETPNLFICFVSNRAILIFPKRAFADDVQRSEFALLLDRSISEGLPAFPVMTAQPSEGPPPPPVPAPELRSEA